MIEQVEKLDDILEPYAGQTVWCSSEDKVYRFDPVEGWQHIPEESDETSIGMNMYDINKQIISQLPTIEEADIVAVKREIIRRYCDQMGSEYYMLLCRDINYYTVFRMDAGAAERIEDALIDCANYIGQIKSIGLIEDEQALELWMTGEEDTYVAYFFPYDNGVIVCA